MGLGEVEELRVRCEELEKLYSEAVAKRDEAIEERNKATVLIALQLERETSELTTQIEKLTREKKNIQEKNEDLSVRLEYAREDLSKIKQRLIKQQLEHEKYTWGAEKASEKATKEIDDLRIQNRQLVTEVEELKQKQNESPNFVEEIQQLTKEKDKLFYEVQQLKHRTDAVTITQLEEIQKESNNVLSSANKPERISSSQEEKGIVKTEDKQDSLVEREVMQSNRNHCSNISHERENNMLDNNTQNDNEPTMDENENEETLECEPRDPVTVRTSDPEDVYEIQEELGKGRFGVVKRAVDKATGQVYAAKYIKLSIAGSKKEDVMREIGIMNKLNSHKRLVTLVDAYHVTRSMIMILEFVSGGELFDRVVECDYLTEKEASYYMNQLLQGLQYMHSRNIVHLDLKPENIVCVSKDSLDIKLIDFGLAQELEDGIKMKALRGTPEFMSPEAVNFDTITLATDMWSVGVIAYILLSGLSPLMGDDDNETLSNVTSAQWDFEDEAFDQISEQAKDFMSKLIVKKPSERLTVSQCLEHGWIKTRVSSSSVKLNTKKLRQFLAKRRWQKSVNALVAVRRLSSVTSLLGMRSGPRPSMAPSLKTLQAAESEGEDMESGEESHTDKTETKENANSSVDLNKPVSPTFTKELTDIAVKKTETVNFEVVVSGDPICTIEWYKNGEKVVEEERHSLVNQGNGTFSLAISDSTDDDAGEYCCVASNNYGKVTTSSQLTVERSAPQVHPPVFEKELTDVTVNEDDTVTFEVLVSGDPNCDIEWYKNGVDVEADPRHVLTNEGQGHYKLVITHCEDDDTGEYCCVASNETGRVTTACDLTVELPAPLIDPPVFEKEFGDVSVYEGETVTFEVLVSGDINCDIDWYKNGGDVEEGPRHKFTDNGNGLFSLVIPECEDDDTGEYCCVASNVAGRVTAAGNLLVRVEDEEEEESEEEEEWPEFHYRTVKIRDGCVDNSYVVESIQLGRGRFGIARKCIELDSGDRYVAKYIKARPSQKTEVKREVFVMNALQHPRLVGLYDAIEEPRYLILILEFMRGGNLASRTGGNPLPEMEAAQIMTQVLEGVKGIHDKGYMHLDLKPENIMFRLEGGSQVKIIDFSLSRKYNPGDEVKVNFGTAEYVAPEIVNYESISPATDMWAVGIICYMMLGGQSPFLGKSESETFANITSAKWKFTEEFDDVSDEARDFVSKLLVKNPKGRTTVDQCLEHPWIKSGGVGNMADLPKISVTLPNGDVCDEIVGATDHTDGDTRLPNSGENPLHDSNNNELLQIAIRKLEIKVSQLELEKSELTDELLDEKDKVESLEVDMEEGKDLLIELRQKIARLEKENKKLSTEFRFKNDLLMKVGRLENQSRILEEKLEEETKLRDTFEEKYKEVRDKVEIFDSLEEKMYRFEREKKELQFENEKLEEKLLDYDSMKKEKDDEILELKQQRKEIENKYDTLRRDKEALVAELTTKFTVLEKQRMTLESNIRDLTKAKEDKNTKCEELSSKLKAAEERIEKLKQRTSSGLERKLSGVEKEKEETERENLRLKRHNENIQKTCEDLASKLSKAYADMEKYKAGSPRDDADELTILKEKVCSLKETIASAEEERENFKVELDECDAEIEDLQKKVADLKEENKRLLEKNQQHYEEYIDSMPIANDEDGEEQSNSPASSKGRGNTATSSFKTQIIALESTISVLKSDKTLLSEKLSLKEHEVTELEYTVKSQEKEIQRAKEAKAALIDRYEVELEEAEDLFESRETEIRAGYEKRIEALENLVENAKSRDATTDQPSTKPTTLSSMIEEIRQLDHSELGDNSKKVAQILSKQIDMLDQMANEDVVVLISKKDAIVHELQLKCESLESQLKQANFDYTKLQNDHERLQRNYDEVDSQLKECAGVASRAEEERESLKKEFHDLEVQLKKYKTAESKPQEPEKSTKEKENDLQLFEALQEERTWLKDKVTELEQVKKEIEISLDAVRKEAARLQKHNTDLEHCLMESNHENEKMQEQMKAIKSENEKIKEQLFSCQNKYEQQAGGEQHREENNNEDKTVITNRKLTESKRNEKNDALKNERDVVAENNNSTRIESASKKQSELEKNSQSLKIIRQGSLKMVSENITYSESTKVQANPQIESVVEVASVSKEESLLPSSAFQSHTCTVLSEGGNTGWQSVSNAELKWLENGPNNVAEDVSILQVELERLKQQLQGLEAEKEEGLRILHDLQNKNRSFEKQKEHFQFCLEKQTGDNEKLVIELKSLRKEKETLEAEKEEKIRAWNELEQKHNRFEREVKNAREEIGRLKRETNLDVEMDSTDNMHTVVENTKLLQEIRSLKQQHEVMEHNYDMLGKENESQKKQFDVFREELKANDKEKEQVQIRYFKLQEKHQTLKSSFRQIEEQLGSEMGELQESQQIVKNLTCERDRLRKQNSKLSNEIEKYKDELYSLQENITEKANVELFEEQIAVFEENNRNLEKKLSEARHQIEELQENKNVLEQVHDEMKEAAYIKIRQLESQKAELIEKNDESDYYKVQTSVLQQEIKTLEEKLQNAMNVNCTEQNQSKRQSIDEDRFIFELERMRQRLISNVLKPLEEGNLPWNFREASNTDTEVGSNDSASSANVDAGRSEVWCGIQENIVTLIQERERFITENRRLNESWARLKKEYQIKRDECSIMRTKIEDLSKELDETKESASLSRNADNTIETASLTRKLKLAKFDKEKLETQIEKASAELHATNQELKQVREEKENLVRMIYLFEETQTQLQTLTKANEKVEVKLRTFEAKWEEMPHVQAFAVCHPSETDVIEATENLFESGVSSLQETNCINEYGAVNGETDENTYTEEKVQVDLIRETVRKNRRIFELIQENSCLSKKLEETPNDSAAKLECVSKELESVKLELETVRQEKVICVEENIELKKYIKTNDLAVLLSEIEELKAIVAALRRERDGLTSDLSARDKRIVLFEKEIKDLTSSRAINGDARKSRVMFDNEGQEQLDVLRNELREVKHGEALLQAELEKLHCSHQSVLREAQEEMEGKWSKQLRKACMELQNELTEKHATEKQVLLKREADLQNIVRQMKLVMDKRTHEFDRREKRWKQELISAKSPHNNSRVSLNSSSDESGEIVNNSSLTNDQTNPKDTLSDRELRRVAYKLNSEEWSQLGTFLGLVDSELFAIGSLNMGPQEKAFRVACTWRTRCKLGRSQMVSQLAIALEEIRRKDAAQFVIEQFLEGKGRKKFFGW